MLEAEIDKAGNRICKRCPFIIAAQKEYHKLCMQVNRKFGGIKGVTCGVNGWDEKLAEEFYTRIGLDIETGLPTSQSKEDILKTLIKKLEDDYVYYQNASLGWSAPSVVSRGHYAHELLEWIKERTPKEDEDIRGKDNATE